MKTKIGSIVRACHNALPNAVHNFEKAFVGKTLWRVEAITGSYIYCIAINGYRQGGQVFRSWILVKK